MADFVVLRKGRNALSSILHVVLNLILAVFSIYITYATGSFALGVILVLLSKWRTFAVRIRYLWINIKSNLVDIIVGLSFVFIAYCAGTTFQPIHVILMVLYSIWLIVIKPKTGEVANYVQAALAIFLGSTALTLMTASADSIFLVLGCFVIGYAAARHVLVQHEDNSEFELVSLAAGILMAEIAWLCHSWLIVYSFDSLGIIVPQLSVIQVICSFLFGYTYSSISRNNGEIKWEEVGMPTIFSILLIAIIVIWFSSPVFNV